MVRKITAIVSDMFFVYVFFDQVNKSLFLMIKVHYTRLYKVYNNLIMLIMFVPNSVPKLFNYFITACVYVYQ